MTLPGDVIGTSPYLAPEAGRRNSADIGSSAVDVLWRWRHPLRLPHVAGRRFRAATPWDTGSAGAERERPAAPIQSQDARAIWTMLPEMSPQGPHRATPAPGRWPTTTPLPFWERPIAGTAGGSDGRPPIGAAYPLLRTAAALVLAVTVGLGDVLRQFFDALTRRRSHPANVPLRRSNESGARNPSQG